MSRYLIPFFVIGILSVGCTDNQPPTGAGDTSKNQSALEKLSPEDRTLAERQQNCPVSAAPLGSMGTPIKVMVKDKPVFICCQACQKKVEDNPDEMLKKVEELKANTEPK